MAGVTAYAGEVAGKDKQFIRHASALAERRELEQPVGSGCRGAEQAGSADDWRKRLLFGRSEGK